jgi:hypothetical protein
MARRSRALSLIAALALLGALIAGCGSSSGPLANFERQVESVCEKGESGPSTEEIEERQKEIAEEAAETPAGLRQEIKEVAELTREETAGPTKEFEDLKAIEPPAKVRAGYNKVIGAFLDLEKVTTTAARRSAEALEGKVSSRVAQKAETTALFRQTDDLKQVREALPHSGLESVCSFSELEKASP